MSFVFDGSDAPSSGDIALERTRDMEKQVKAWAAASGHSERARVLRILKDFRELTEFEMRTEGKRDFLKGKLAAVGAIRQMVEGDEPNIGTRV